MSSDNQAIMQLAARILASGYENPADWFVNYLTGGSTDSGVAVNANTALTYSTVWSCVDIISSDVASLPLNDTALDDEGNKTVNRGSATQWLLNHEPNENMTAFAFRKTLQSHVLLWGNGYAAIQRDMSGRPRQLIPIHPQCVRQIWYDDDGRLWYDVNGIEDFVSSRNMLHVIGLSDDGVCGYSVITKARNSWGLGLAEERHGSSHFKNGASPKVILKTGRNLTEEEAKLLLKMFNSENAGSENAGKTALAAGGLEIETVGVSNEDAQWLEGRKFQRAEVATWFSLPEHMVNGEKGPYNSTIAENSAYLRRTLKKHLCAWEQESERKLLVERERRSGTRRLMHDTTELINTDPETRHKIARENVAGEVWTRNEGRRFIGTNKFDDPMADELSSPNTRRDNAPSEGETDSGLDDEAMARQRELISGRMGKLIDTERRNISRGVKTKNFVEWLDTFYGRFTGQVEEAMEPLIVAYSALPGVRCETTATTIASQHAEESKRQLLEVAGYSTSIDDLATTVTDLTSRWEIRADSTADAVIGETNVPNH